ncbi:hypothetical protein [Deinococcus koreensis]|uniref:Uncharacterized protein n=1 Tax=Deinococcus koreensis TaxID=2054903 RepID=A0A2K3V1R7_9DEIO|nr:hypothetical protein [Deinococcus koreensis]PNY82721.1 hypothetical protein CVO96_16390 [Deinococcus koreensis]
MLSSTIRRALRPAALSVLAVSLSGCAWGAFLSPLTALERSVNGLYEGIGVGGTGRVPYRLTLTIQEREGRAAGVLTNLESRKSYAASGTFRKAAQGGALELQMYENGDQHRANLHAVVAGEKINGTLRTVLLGKELLGYVVELNKVGAAPAAVPASPTTPTPPPPANP